MCADHFFLLTKASNLLPKIFFSFCALQSHEYNLPIPLLFQAQIKKNSRLGR